MKVVLLFTYRDIDQQIFESQNLQQESTSWLYLFHRSTKTAYTFNETQVVAPIIFRIFSPTGVELKFMRFRFRIKLFINMSISRVVKDTPELNTGTTNLLFMFCFMYLSIPRSQQMRIKGLCKMNTAIDGLIDRTWPVI